MPQRLRDGSRIAVIGGGPAGSFFGYFALQLARRVGLQLDVDIFEPRDYSCAGPQSCNMCGGIVSESLLQKMVAEGIRLPAGVVQRRIDSYFLHTDQGTVRIETPLREKRIAAVYRGCGPRDSANTGQESFDAFVLGMAVENGVRWRKERVTGVSFDGELPRLATKQGGEQEYDLVVGAVGVNSAALKLFDELNLGYVQPRTEKAYVCEFHLGETIVNRYLGNAMHVFLLDIPRLEFAAIIPKSDYVTVCLLGQDVDKELIARFLGSDEVRECMPPHWRPPSAFCRCSPRISVVGSVRPYADRFVCVGDCGMTRLYKDGIGAAYRTAKAAALAAVFDGVSAEDFRRRFWPVCRNLERDNKIGKLIFRFTQGIQKSRRGRGAVWSMTSKEQRRMSADRRMSVVLWDTFTGSAPYRDVLLRTFHPAFVGRFARELASRGRPTNGSHERRRKSMVKAVAGALGKQYRAGEVIYHQGERGDCMFVAHGGEVEIIRRDGDREFCLEVLKDGDLFGVTGLFDRELRAATARALTDVWVYTLERRTLLRSIHEDPSLAFRILEQLADRIDELETALVGEAQVSLDLDKLGIPAAPDAASGPIRPLPSAAPPEAPRPPACAE